MGELCWELKVPIFKNGLILKQMGIAIGIPFGVLILFLLFIKAWYALILIGLTLLLTVLMILILFRGTYDVRYVINREGVSCHTQEKQQNRVRRLAFTTLILGLLRGNLTVAGAGLLADSGSQPWTNLFRLSSNQNDHLVRCIRWSFCRNKDIFYLQRYQSMPGDI
ncbi:MAG: hypothetical protein PHV32_04825 [Eubacteriales bacterium]|nr:hypothetical protein [Oscillospiraceae bacterium]MDD4493659.1 hypothetical protein [Eubacteriales bacterium]